MISSFRQKVQTNTDWGKPDPAEMAPARRKPARKAGSYTQITAHRLFPVFAALWFAALFGLGSLAISSEALGKLVIAIGLPALVPAAAPPLGFTAKLLVALLLTVIGGGFGLLLGLRLRPKSPRDSRPATRAAEPVPAPVVAAQAADAGIPKIRARDAHPDAPPRRPLVLTEAFADAPETVVPEAAVPLVRLKPGSAGSGGAASMAETWLPVYAEANDADLPPLDLAETENVYEASLMAEPDAAEFAGKPDAPSAAEPVPEPVPVPLLLAATPQVPSGFTMPSPSREQLLAGEPWSPVASAALESLGLVQLIERLALAIAARKAVVGAGPPPQSDSNEHAAAEDGVVCDPLAPFARPTASSVEGEAVTVQAAPAASAREAILRRLGGNDTGNSAEISGSAIPNDAIVTLRPQLERILPGQATADRPAFAPPHASAAAASLDTDDALRAALATLQRMTARG